MESLIKIKKEFDYDLKNEWENLQKNSNINFFQTFKWQKRKQKQLSEKPNQKKNWLCRNMFQKRADFFSKTISM